MSILSIRDLKVEYATQDGAVEAVDGVSLNVAEGQHLGLIGESGCGKTTLLKAIVQVLPRNGRVSGGKIMFKGMDLMQLPAAEMRQLRWREIATIPQASMDSLNPVQRVGSQLMKLLRVRGGFDKRAARRRAVDLFDMVGLDTERLMHYPHEFSGGMKQRAVIAMALALEPSLLIADEPVTALDVIVQHQILEVLRELEEELNLTVMLITHDISVVAQVCDSVAVMYAGRIVEQAAAEPFFASPAHPYSLGLQQAFPNLARPRDVLVSIEGYPPDLREPPAGCRFAERCPFVQEACKEHDPRLEIVGDNRLAACLRTNEMDALRVQAEDPTLWQHVEVAQLVGQPPPKSPPTGQCLRDPIAMERDLNAPPLAANSVETLPLPDASDARHRDGGKGPGGGVDDILLEMRDVSKRFKIGGGLAGLLRGDKEQTVYAVNNISFTLRRGESLGLAGESGCGKSTTGKLLVKLLDASDGEIVFAGEELSGVDDKDLLAFRSRVQLMFQNPFEALNPRFTLYRSLTEPLIIHGWKDENERTQRVVETLDRVNLRPAEVFLDKYPHQLSGGQLQRVVLARALVLHPDFLVADEPVSMLDVSVRAGILNTTRRLARELGLATVYISHDLSLLQYTCDRIAIMYLGEIVEIGPSDEVINNPQHPYTQALIAAVPVPDPTVENPPLRIREGVPRPTEQFAGCPFAQRCPEVMEACLSVRPPLIADERAHQAQCHLYGEHHKSPKLNHDGAAPR
ncbi:MAG: ABC transporter ATP-binding protein [Chloroflexota bacterium]|nr:ABC transporter ATP-binding protein [Chloroflexota bacterium]MDE2947288.1 ABC transporter ATP-binding protein [Chloroflexota bacterium]